MMQLTELEGLNLSSQRWMSQQFFMFFITWGIFLPYWSGWMVAEKGITVEDVGYIMSAGLVARGIATLFIFPYLSRVVSSKRMIQIMAAGSLLAVLLYIPAESYVSLFLVTLMLNLFYPVLMPALDSTASILVVNKELKHYGKSRSWGSIAFVVAGLVLTLFISWFGDMVILWAMLAGVFLITVVSSINTPAVLTKKPESSGRATSIFALLKTKHLVLVLIIVMLIQGGHATYYNYGYLYLQHINTPTMLIGLIINVAVLAEIIFFAKADTLFSKWSVGKLLAFSAVGSSVRWVIVYLFPSVAIFTISQVLHALSFAMAHFAFVKWITKNIAPTNIALVQGIYSALALSWATALFTMFGGKLYEIEPGLAFLGMVACTLPAAIIAFILIKKEKIQS